MQRVLCVCVRDEKSLYIEPKDIKNIYFLIRKVLKYWTKWNKKSIFNLFLSLFWHLKIFQFSMYRMRYLAESRAFSHEFFTFIYIYIYWVMPLYSPMLLIQYAPKTNSLCFCHATLIFPCSWHIMLLRQECRVLQLISHVLGQKMKFTIHCYYSSVTIHLSLFIGTIHCCCSLRIFAYLRGAVPYIWSKCFVCLVQDFFLREGFPLRAFLCEISLLTITSYILYKACNS